MVPCRAFRPLLSPFLPGRFLIGRRSPVHCYTLVRFSNFLQPQLLRFSRKPLVLASLAGYLLLNIIYAVNAFFFHELKVSWGKFKFSKQVSVQMEFLLFECLQDLTGGDLVFLLGINALLVDTTAVEERTRRWSSKMSSRPPLRAPLAS